MGVIDESKPSDSNKDKSPLHSSTTLSSPKNEAEEVPLPQMLITSAEQVNEEIELAIKEEKIDEKPVLATIREENEEEKEIKDKKDASSAQQRPLVISAVSESTHDVIDESSSSHDKSLPPRTESPPLSAVQRPLVLEQMPAQSEVSSSQEAGETSYDHSVGVSASVVQRPLIVDGSCVSSERSTPCQTTIDSKDQDDAFGTAGPVSSYTENRTDTSEVWSYENGANITGQDSPELVVESSKVPKEAALPSEGESSPSKLKGLFDGLPKFSVPKFHIGSSKDPSVLTTDAKDVQSQHIPNEICADSGISPTDKSIKDGKPMFSFPKFPFGEHKHTSKEHKDTALGHETSQFDRPLSEEFIDGSEIRKSPKEDSKVTFHLPKFSFGSSKENKGTVVEQQDSFLNSPTTVDGHSPDATKEDSKAGFSLPKLSFSFSKEQKEAHREIKEQDPSLSSPTTVDGHSPGTPKEESKTGFSLSKLSFGFSKEQKEAYKEVKEQDPSLSSPTVDSHFPDGTKEDTKAGFSLSKLSFGFSKEQKEVHKEIKDDVSKEGKHNFSVCTPTMGSADSAGSEGSGKNIKDDAKHPFHFPKFGFASSKEQGKEPKSVSFKTDAGSSANTPEPVSVLSDDKGSSQDTGKSGFSLPKFGFGKEQKEPASGPHAQTAATQNVPVFIEVTVTDVDAKDAAKETSKQPFAFPKFSFGSSKTDKTAKDISGTDVLHDSATRNAPVSAEVSDVSKESGKHGFSFPKFSFGSSKDDEAAKELKAGVQSPSVSAENQSHSTKEQLSDTGAKTEAEDHKHLFSFPKFSIGSPKEHKESPKQPKEGLQKQSVTPENYQSPAESASSKDTVKGDKPFFPKISFGSFREQKDATKDKKEITLVKTHSELGTQKMEMASSKGSEKFVQKQVPSKIGAPLAIAESDPFKKPRQALEQESSAMKGESKKAPKEEKSGKTPDTLYETCCMRLAGMICNKAMEIVSEHSSKRGPPKKPPKPSSETIAKARAAIVAKRVQEHERRRHFGDDICHGYDIRFADDDTESSTDYKDVDNTAYIIDSDCSAIVRKMKSENLFETFSCPSTCSGMSSYYTADDATIKDGYFSDHTLESVSLGSLDSLAYKPALSSLSEDMFPSAAEKVDHESRGTIKKPVEKQKSAPARFSSFFSRSKPDVSTDATPHKRAPPPVPPKPLNWQGSGSLKKSEIPTSSQPEVQKCVDKLSLSPRPQTRAHFGTGGIRKRPLTIAGIKETEFPMYMKTIQKEATPKKAVLTTVVKNQSLQKTPVISASTSALDKPRVPSPKPNIQTTSLSSLRKKPIPERPPPPVNYMKKASSALDIGTPRSHSASPRRTASTVFPPEKPVPKARQHVSPPRPPPPKIKPVTSPPARPPPPAKFSKSSPNIPGEFSAISVSSLPIEETITEVANEARSEEKTEVVDKQEVESSLLSSDSVAVQNDLRVSAEEGAEASVTVERTAADEVADVSLLSAKDEVLIDTTQGERKAHVTEEPTVSDHIVQGDLPSSAEHTEGDIPIPSQRTQRKPRPPPRTRRIRSRTVEIVSLVSEPQERKRRSHSLSEIDVKKRTENLEPDVKPELKELYTSVHKDRDKNKDDQLKVDARSKERSSQENISSRPLPAPPPPPRSKHKDISPKRPEKQRDHAPEKEEPVSIKPPVRKKKELKSRSRSLEDKEKEVKKAPSGVSSVTVNRANSFTSGVPKKPKRRQKFFLHELQFDENANIAESVSQVPESPHGTEKYAGSRSYGREMSSSSEKHAQRELSERQISHSSWYDESDVSGDLGDVDTMPNSLKTSTERLDFSTGGDNLNKQKQLRVKQEGYKKPRESSKFYVDFSADEFEEKTHTSEGTDPPATPNVVDKETSPLPLECSEKSVQTSLETLSQGRVSRSEQSDDTDELLDLAQTLQDELKTILSRHKTKELEGESGGDTSSSQNQLDDPGASCEMTPPTVKRKEMKQRSARGVASSELWQMSSSDESDENVEERTKLSETLVERRKKKVFYIAQEIMTSEEAFVDALKLLNVDFRSAVEEANKQRGSPVIPNEVLNQILNHLPQLQHLNDNLLMELKDRVENWYGIGKIADVIVRIGPFLKLYSWYIQDFESMVALLDDAKKKYLSFAQVVKEFESNPRCNRLALNHYMLKPVQRIPQYRLLLQEYLHNIVKDSPDYDDTVTALQIVSEVANHANESMKQGDNFQKLISIQNSIFGHKEIIKPGRVFVKEGELMKLSRKGMQPRWFVLLSDVLLYLTPVQQGLYRVNHELALTGMKVAIPIQQDYQNEFSIISVTRSFTLAAKSLDERQEWIVALTKTIEENASKRSTFTNVRLQQKVVCSVCSSSRAALHYLGNRNARVCDECYLKLEQGSGGYTESGETDSDNQQIAVKAHLRTDSKHGRKPKRQLPSVLKEVCANDQGSSISGYLLKKSGKSWKRDWFVVKDKVLYEYRASEDVAALKSLPLLGYQIETFSEPIEGIDSALLFQLTHPGQPPVIFHADNAASAERWISALREATVLG